MPESINEDCQEFLRSAADADSGLTRLRTDLWKRISYDFGDEECLTCQASAFGIMAIDAALAEYRLQIDNALDALPIETDKLGSFFGYIEKTYELVGELDDIWESYDESDNATFYRLAQIQITLLELLALIPGWPDIGTLKEQIRFGKQALEGKRAGNLDADDDYSEFRGFADHIGTMLVRMVHSDSANATIHG